MLQFFTILGVMLAYAVFWCFVLYSISRMTGWGQLAKSFRTRLVPAGQRFSWQSIRLGWMGGYNHCVNIVVNAEGLYLALQLPFRCGHAPLFIPWSEISTGQRKRQLFGGPQAELAIGTPTIATMRISMKVIEAANVSLDDGE